MLYAGAGPENRGADVLGPETGGSRATVNIQHLDRYIYLYNPPVMSGARGSRIALHVNRYDLFYWLEPRPTERTERHF